MSTENPPIYQASIFNQAFFNDTVSSGGLITESYLSSHYLKFPTAQSATETIPILVTTADATINGLTVGKGGSSIGTNTAIGSDALLSVTTGSNNVALGYQAGKAGTANITGSNNTYIGYQAQANGAAYTKSTALGSGAIITGNNQVVLGTTTETVRYNKAATLYTSVPTFAAENIGYYYSDTTPNNNPIAQSGLTIFKINNLAIGRYIVMFAANYDSNNSSNLMDITTELYLLEPATPPYTTVLYYTVQQVAAGYEVVDSFTLPVDITDDANDISVTAYCTVGNFDVLNGFLYAMKIA
jgi:hypothetical protein